MAVEIVGEKIEVAIVVDEASVDAAVVEVADAVQACRICDRKRLQEDRVDQREDRCVRADAEGDREDNRSGEAGGLGELAEGKFDIGHGQDYGRERRGRGSSV